MEGDGAGGGGGEREELGKTEGVGVSNVGRQSVGLWRQRSSATLTPQSGLGLFLWIFLIDFLRIETVSVRKLHPENCLHVCSRVVVKQYRPTAGL